MTEKKTYCVVGLMSGTSLDGLDIAYCIFNKENNNWKYRIDYSETIAYSEEWKNKLISLETANALMFQQTHVDYGIYLGLRVSDFIIKNNIHQVDFVASHGHTIFHQPENKLTVQIGLGSAIASKCKLPIVSDFRTLDVALGGQGAPLVPIGDKLLFSEFDYCLNLGGFANISFDLRNRRIAFDICPVNIVMNAICERIGKPFDDKGMLARSGMRSNYLLNELNLLPFYKQSAKSAKSLGKEWVLQNIFPLIDKYELSESDILTTFVEHIAQQVGKVLEDKPAGKMLVTGGGAYNLFLMEKIKEYTKSEIIVPDNNLIEYKEAIVFAFLGTLRMRNEINCLRSVTGASEDTCSGSIYYYKN